MSSGDAIERLHVAIDDVAALDRAELPTPEALAELLAAVKAAMRRLELVFIELLRSFELRGGCGPTRVCDAEAVLQAPVEDGRR